MSARLVKGDILASLRALSGNSVDAVFSDVPYGLGTNQPTREEISAYLLGEEMDTGGDFMGKAWHVPSIAVWEEMYRVLKPGGYMLIYAGARTADLISMGMRVAGFEIRDVLLWVYAKAMPKNQNIALAIDQAAGVQRKKVGTRKLTGNAGMSTKEKGGTYGVSVGSVGTVEVPVTVATTELAKVWQHHGSALKPNYEPVILARKPLEGTMAQNVAKWGVGGISIDACRPGDDVNTINRHTDGAHPFGGAAGSEYTGTEVQGRWPGNVLLDEGAAEIFDAENGVHKSGALKKGTPVGSSKLIGGARDFHEQAVDIKSSSGGISRYFFCAKVSQAERNAGCDHLPLRSAGEVTEREDGSEGLNNGRAGAGRTGGARNHHPMLKPIALDTWLATLIKPPQDGTRVCLVPYCGSGSEMIGALRAGWDYVVGIDREYQEIAQARIAHWCPDATVFQKDEAA